jgi:uncharacterized membrane protein YsdA (DUF1294 family)
MISGVLPLWLGGWCLLASAVSFALYGHDKRAAQRKQWRIPERTLQLLAFAGGWPGALLGQALFRHKHRKAAFQWVFWLCVLANVASIAVMLREFSLRPVTLAIGGCRPHGLGNHAWLPTKVGIYPLRAPTPHRATGTAHRPRLRAGRRG